MAQLGLTPTPTLPVPEERKIREEIRRKKARTHLDRDGMTRRKGKIERR